jgi:sugar lactone lactonase YvrE
VSVWIKSPLLNPKTQKCCYGANGLEFDRGDLFVANTDFGTIVQIKTGKDGKPHAEVWVKSPALVGADGISFDVRHNAYVTADYQNALVEVTANGDIYTLATAKDGLDFPADTAFGQASGERRFLLWTSGGWHNKMPSLQKMDVGIPDARLP